MTSSLAEAPIRHSAHDALGQGFEPIGTFVRPWSGNPAPPREPIPTSRLLVPLALELHHPQQRDLELSAKGCIGGSQSGNIAVAVGDGEQQNVFSPVCKSLEPAALTVGHESGDIARDPHKAVLLGPALQNSTGLLANSHVHQRTSAGLGQLFTGHAHGQLRQWTSPNNQRKTCGHGGPAHHYHRITAELVPRAP